MKQITFILPNGKKTFKFFKYNINTLANYYDFIKYIKLNNKSFLKNPDNYKIIINGIILNPYTFNKIKTHLFISHNLDIEFIPKVKGGFIQEVFSVVITMFKLLTGIPKFILWIFRLILWLIQVLVYLFGLLLQVLNKDGIIYLVKYLTTEIILAPFKLLFTLIRNFVNKSGEITVLALSGADNVKGHDEEEPTEFHSEKSKQEKIYITSEGTVPFSVIIATILCPPIGVFMEYGLTGWVNILICALLTLVFYFPGLIYALVMLYC